MISILAAGGRRRLLPAALRTQFVHLTLERSIWQLQGDRVTVAAGIRLSTRKVYKVDTLKWKLTGLVNPDAEFDSGNRSGRSRAAGICLEIL